MSNKEFGYPEYDKDGIQQLTSMTGPYSDALMCTSVCRLEAGSAKTFLPVRLG